MSEAIPAATLVLMRDDPAGPPELLIVTRGRGLAFAGGALAFPGGRIDAADRALAARFAGEDAAAAIAAVRETIEETGIAPAALAPVVPADALAMQAALHAGNDFAALFDERELTLDCDALVPFARWKPAFAHARVFDTLFFIARAPAGDWPPRPQSGECEAAEWMSAAEALARIAAGTASAIFPTTRNLERLARLASFDEAAADAAAHPIAIITPWVEQRGGEPHVCIPDGAGYPVTSEPLATAFRA